MSDLSLIIDSHNRAAPGWAPPARDMRPHRRWQSACRFAGSTQPGEAHLYLVEIKAVAVKVGVTINVESRVQNHVNLAHAHDRKIGWVWVSTAHVEAQANELLLVQMHARSAGEPREYLRTTMDELLAVVALLRMTRANGAPV